MGRLIAIVAVLLMSSAISLVTARFQSRRLFIQSDRLSDKAHELDTDWRRLQLERAELARNARIDGIARQDLKMVNVSPAAIIYIKEGADPGAALAAPAAASPAAKPPAAKPQAVKRAAARPAAHKAAAGRHP